ncbi:MAG: hypothetical protein IPL41_09960 [Micropruina sp.]|nr:hypothetical protein [Micropruina sp.]
MKFVRNLGIAAGVVIVGMIGVAVACFITGAGVQIPWLVDAPPRSGAAPSLQLTFEPLGLLVITLGGALLLTMITRLRPAPSHL